jgi:imidazoleglycerol phosphate dehydratase HisB/histidinol-phosphate/aromatic aminotransferase/cobyric acid decarboxylase-like protein
MSSPVLQLARPEVVSLADDAPENQPQALRERMAELYGVPTENLAATQDTDNAVDLLIRAFCNSGIDSVVSLENSSVDFSAKLQGVTAITAPSDEDFTFDKEAFVQSVKRESNVKLAFLSSPIRPTGAIIESADILFLCERFSKTVIVVDESTIEFSGCESLSTEATRRDNLVVLRSLSAAYDIDGAQCGAVIANSEIAHLIRRIAAPLPGACDDIAMNALSAVQAPVKRANIERIIIERERIRSQLSESAFVERIFPSEGNFLFVETRNTRELKSVLARAGVRLAFLEERFLRLPIGAPQENDLILDAFGLRTSNRKVRRGQTLRETKETRIAVSVDLDNETPIDVKTGNGFFDHMLEQIARHGGFSLILQCEGDLHIDAHHTIEDCMLALGEAMREALGDRRGVARFGAVLPMDETRAEALIDLSGRPYAKFTGSFSSPMIGDYPTQMTAHAMRSLAESMRAAIHITVEGENDHHMTEACYKSLGRALRQAIRIESGSIPSSKGVLA